MSKHYGLIIPGQQKKQVITAAATRTDSKPSIFDESSSDDEAKPQFKPKGGTVQEPSLMERRMARSIRERALKEDPTVFQYDELYDAMESKRNEEQETKSKEPKKPKYIGRLMECAERRKLENELRVERQVQKEREQEGDEFKDKESFVTVAYRKKLEEMRQLQEQEKRDEYLESIGDVTKQKDLDGFYRHLFEQKIGSSKEVKKPDFPAVTSAGDGEDIAYQPIKSGKGPQQRAYRKRHTSNDTDEEDAESGGNKVAKKVHLPNNIDADSDFSIDSSTDEENDDKKEKDTKPESKTNSLTKENVTSTAHNLEALKNDKQNECNTKEDKEKIPLSEATASGDPANAKPKVKKDKSAIWKKRTVGEVFEAAVQRYYERRAARSA